MNIIGSQKAGGHYWEMPGDLITKSSAVAVVSSLLEGNKREWFLISKAEAGRDNLIVEKIEECEHVNISGLSACVLKNNIVYCLGGTRDGHSSRQVVSYDLKSKIWNIENTKLQYPRSNHISVTTKNSEDILVLGDECANSGAGEHFSFMSGCYQSQCEVAKESLGKIISYAYRAKKKIVYIWIEGGVHKEYRVSSNTWNLLVGNLASRIPKSFESVVLGDKLIAVSDNNWVCTYSFSGDSWSEFYELRIPPKTGDLVHLARVAHNRIGLVYICGNNLLHIRQFQINKDDIIHILGLAFDVLTRPSKISTLTSMWITQEKGDKVKKRTRMELELVEENRDANEYSLKLQPDADTSCRDVTLVNTKAGQHIRSFGNLLWNVFPSDGKRPCIHEQYEASLRDVVALCKKDVLRYSVQTSLYIYYEMSPFLTDLVKKIFETLLFFVKQGYFIKGVDLDNVVFVKSDKSRKSPKLVDCQILGEKNENTQFKSLADLILNCMGGIGEEKLSLTLQSFLKCLREKTSDGEWVTEKLKSNKWECLLFHPIFLDDEQKFFRLIKIRESLRGNEYQNFRVQLTEMVPYKISGVWTEFLSCSPSRVFGRQIPKIGKDPKCMYDHPVYTSPQEIVKFLRDCIHLNDNSSYTHTSLSELGKMTRLTCPGLLPVSFEKHGN